MICVAGQFAGGLYVDENDQHHWVRTIFLKPEFQRLGVGTSILKKEASRAKDAGKPFFLKVIKINPAKRLYERLGFQVINEDDATFSMQMS